ncbi:helicase ARIP4-like isoform X2 [Limulus polyphemus]|uniref:Helicase ARIP4-like isoform X2 n=1 Tax=Limulus polyphemus TaxID=6850 RepID=A0ABM1S2H0_LIMPO|nr:helicase ARIP4-like isoform X2 [Limulus polyphemus]
MDADDFLSGSLLGHTKAHNDRLKAWDEGITELEKLLEAARKHQSDQPLKTEVTLGSLSLSISPASTGVTSSYSKHTKDLVKEKSTIQSKDPSFSKIKSVDVSETSTKKIKLSSDETSTKEVISSASAENNGTEKTENCQNEKNKLAVESCDNNTSESDTESTASSSTHSSEDKNIENTDQSLDSDSDYNEVEHRKKKVTEKKKKKNPFQRREIRSIMSESELDAKTIQAQKEEQERKKFLQEAQLRVLQERRLLLKRLEENPELQLTCIQPPSTVSVHPQQITEQQANGTADCTGNDSIPVKKKSLDKDIILIGSSDEEGDNNFEDQSQKFNVTLETSQKTKDVINVALENNDEGKTKEKSIEEDDVVMVSDEDEDSTLDDDHASSGTHTNDALNQPNEDGFVLVNIGHPPEELDIFLAPQLGRSVKPHQIGGIRFLYDNVVESLERFKTSGGFGCILAHSMGLGKTLQIISFTEVFLRHTSARNVLCIVPINTLQNWMAEFNMWLPHEKYFQSPVPPEQFRKRNFDVFLLNENHKTLTSRAELIMEWKEKGGVLLMGYEMFRMFALKKIPFSKKKRDAKKELDYKELERNRNLLEEIYLAIINPGPDLVICDEGHRIKNSHASTSTALKSIRTKRRVVLTGYPLQNNLLEYWCMVDFVRPNYLGNRNEFCNMFERPIQNGQCLDSTPKDRKQMRYRAHVLHSLLEGFVQRRGHTVLKSSLPPKEEHVLLVRMTPIQRKLYNALLRYLRFGNNVCNPLKFFAICCKIWNHPDVLYKVLEDQRNQGNEDLDLDFDFGLPGSKKGTKPGAASMTTSAKAMVGKGPLVGSEMIQAPRNNYIQEVSLGSLKDKNDKITYEWASPLMVNYRPRILENSYKMEVLFAIIEQTIKNGDKLLVFSQSLFTLNLLEEFLAMKEVPLRPAEEKWCRNVNYFRLDGSTNGLDREKIINDFNINPAVNLFLLSTRAGCLGINLIGANRIVVYDASWNPCHDAQAVCRIYRYGQSKSCHIYRLVTDNSLEKKIYERQVNKQGMSNRVVDELNPSTNFTWGQVTNLLNYQEEENPVPDLSESAAKVTDPVLRYLCQNMNYCLSKEPFEHESLLIDRKELKLTKQEKRLAKQTYELEKRANMCSGGFMRPVYLNNGQFSANPLGRPPLYGSPRGYPGGLYSRPQQSTPVPMQPMGNMAGGRQLSPYVSLIQSLIRQGVNVQRVTVPNTVSIPSSSVPGQSVVLTAGQEVLVLKTPKGVYLRLPDGRLVAVRLPPDVAENFRRQGQFLNGLFGDGANSALQQSHPDGTKRQSQHSFGIVQPTLQCGGTVQFSTAQLRNPLQSSPPEVIDLSDDDDDDGAMKKERDVVSKKVAPVSNDASSSCSEASLEEDYLKKTSSSSNWTTLTAVSRGSPTFTTSKSFPGVPLTKYVSSLSDQPYPVSTSPSLPNKNVFHQMVSSGYSSLPRNSNSQLDRGGMSNTFQIFPGSQSHKLLGESQIIERKKSSHTEQNINITPAHPSLSNNSNVVNIGGIPGVEQPKLFQKNGVHKQLQQISSGSAQDILRNQYSNPSELPLCGQTTTVGPVSGSGFDRPYLSQFNAGSQNRTTEISLPAYTKGRPKCSRNLPNTAIDSGESTHISQDNLHSNLEKEFRESPLDQNNYLDQNNTGNFQLPGYFTQQLNMTTQRSSGQGDMHYQNNYHGAQQCGFNTYPHAVQQLNSNVEVPNKNTGVQNLFQRQKLEKLDLFSSSVLQTQPQNTQESNQLLSSSGQGTLNRMQEKPQSVTFQSIQLDDINMSFDGNEITKNTMPEHSFSPVVGAGTMQHLDQMLPSFDCKDQDHSVTGTSQNHVGESSLTVGQKYFLSTSHHQPDGGNTSSNSTCVPVSSSSAYENLSASSQLIDSDFSDLENFGHWERSETLNDMEALAESSQRQYQT